MATRNNHATCCTVECTSTKWVPGDHFFLLVGGIATAAQILIRGGQEVERVVLKVLVNEREEHLKGNKDDEKPGQVNRIMFERALHMQYLCRFLTLAKNLISCS